MNHDEQTVLERDVSAVLLRALLLRQGGSAEFDPDELYNAVGALRYELGDGVLTAEVIDPLDENCALDDQDGDDEGGDE